MKIKVGIIGGSGYTGIELLRIIHQHPLAEVTSITSRALQGKKISDVFPNMHGLSELVKPCLNVISFSLQRLMGLP